MLRMYLYLHCLNVHFLRCKTVEEIFVYTLGLGKSIFTDKKNG